jgi:hypothetical protein
MRLHQNCGRAPFQPGIVIHIASESLFTSLRNDYSHAPESAREHADVVVGIDREGLHVSSSFCTAYRDDHIHHSGRKNKQGDSAGNRKVEGKAMQLAESGT